MNERYLKVTLLVPSIDSHDDLEFVSKHYRVNILSSICTIDDKDYWYPIDYRTLNHDITDAICYELDNHIKYNDLSYQTRCTSNSGMFDFYYNRMYKHKVYYISDDIVKPVMKRTLVYSKLSDTFASYCTNFIRDIFLKRMYLFYSIYQLIFRKDERFS